MKRYSDWTLFARIRVLILVALVPVLLFILFYLLPEIEDKLVLEKRAQTKNVVDVALNTLQYWNDQTLTHGVPIKEAQDKALQEISKIRYAGAEYFWVNDLEPRMIMHPFKPELNGKFVGENKDPNGKYFFKDFIKVCNEKGAGFVDYMWPKPGFDAPVPKISYVALFKEWGWILGSGIYIDDVQADISAFRLKILLGLGVALVLAFIFSFFFSQKLVAPITKLQNAANRVALGDVDFSIEAKTKDEFGNLEQAFSKMLVNINEQSVIANKIAAGDVSAHIIPRSDKDILSKSLNHVVDTFKDLIVELRVLTDAALNGQLQTRGATDKFSGGFRDIIKGINNTLDAVILPVEEGTQVLSIMATGDFTVPMEGDYKGDHQLIKNSINQLQQSLSQILSEVSLASQAIASASSEISSSTEEMAAGVQEQSAQIAEIASAVDEMTATIQSTANNTVSASDIAKEAGQMARDGDRVVSQTVTGMNNIADVVLMAAAKVNELGESSNQIGEIIQVIDDIADQTNLLALNAAIEAARAGEQGRGFAVVADEVRKLAERTSKATKEIAGMITKIQKDTLEAVSSIDKGTAEVQSGRKLAQKAGEALTLIIPGTDRVVDMISQVATASEQQSTTAEEISKNIEGISSVSNESAQGIQQIAHAADDLNRLTNNLEVLLTKFKVNQSHEVISQLHNAAPKNKRAAVKGLHSA